ncbi:MAG: glycerol-3-phosphate 1-O-acyltransferase PlsY [Gemmataceae bacterium]
MTLTLVIGAVLISAYLLGSVPFGYAIARSRGVNILQQGSGNIGATNVGRILGKKWGILVFLLDFCKGALPVLLAKQLRFSEVETHLWPNTLPVLAGIAAFLGHLFPVFLGFKGGKGVATGAGVIAILVPLWTLAALASWGLTLWWSRYVSLASLVAAVVLLALQLTATPQPWSTENRVISLFCLIATMLVFLRHGSNIQRLIRGTENRLGQSRRTETSPPESP